MSCKNNWMNEIKGIHIIKWIRPIHETVIWDCVDVYVDKNGNVQKNRFGERTINGLLRVKDGAEIAIEKEGYVKIFTKDKNKYSDMIIRLIKMSGLNVLDKIKFEEYER